MVKFFLYRRSVSRDEWVTPLKATTRETALSEAHTYLRHSHPLYDDPQFQVEGNPLDAAHLLELTDDLTKWVLAEHLKWEQRRGAERRAARRQALERELVRIKKELETL